MFVPYEACEAIDILNTGRGDGGVITPLLRQINLPDFRLYHFHEIKEALVRE
jgi:hypothetical protein